MKTRRLLLSAVVVVVALTFASLAGARSAVVGGANGSGTFTDASGDVNGAPDITAVTISDNATSGLITVNVQAAGFAASTNYALVKVYLNTDKNESTGAVEQGGAEYYLGTSIEAGSWGWSIDRWDGSKYTLVPQSPTMAFTRSGDSLTWTVSKADLGNTTGFRFFVWSSTWDANDNMVAEDTAPDGGDWSYDLSVPPPPAVVVRPLIAIPTTSPATVVAGKRLTVLFAVTRSDNGLPLTTGQMICDPSVAGKVIQHAESFKGGTARLSFLVPKTAKAKLLKVKVTIVAGEQSTTKLVSFRVR